MTANWHRIKCIDTDDGKKFEGELPICDDKTGEVKVIVVCPVGHFKSDFTDEYLSEEEDEFIVESYEVYDDIYRAAHGNTPAHFVKHLSNSVVAWDYVPDFTGLLCENDCPDGEEEFIYPEAFDEPFDEIDREDTSTRYGSFMGSADDDSGWDGE